MRFTGFTQICQLSPVATNCKSNEKTTLESRWGRHHPFSQFFECRLCLTLFSTLISELASVWCGQSCWFQPTKGREGDAQPLQFSFMTQSINTPCTPQQTCIVLFSFMAHPMHATADLYRLGSKPRKVPFDSSVHPGHHPLQIGLADGHGEEEDIQRHGHRHPVGDLHAPIQTPRQQPLTPSVSTTIGDAGSSPDECVQSV